MVLTRYVDPVQRVANDVFGHAGGWHTFRHEAERAWEIAFGLAWESMLTDTTPVGCVVIDETGRIVTRGRGRRFAHDPASGQLSYSHLAHAELNASAQLAPTQRYDGYIALTTLEPFLLCVGAAVMSTVGKVEFAGADPYGGAAHLKLENEHTKRLMPSIVGPTDGDLGVLGALLHFAFYVERNVEGAVVRAYQEATSDFVKNLDGTGLTEEIIHLKAINAELASVLNLFD